ncbi:MAG: hypothetical protein IPO66_11700 [Rhodanobacteraceae bacterium]|nr:hypothetical protein [Rhodanobacteraceae bacterium]
MQVLSSDVMKLRAIKLVHTVVWVLLAGCVIAIPILALTENVTIATWVLGLVMLEVIVLVLNGMRCPLTDIAARYTQDRKSNFDIYLPEWLAENNKLIFGWLYVIGLVITAWSWSSRS